MQNRSRKLRKLAEKVRKGESVDWDREKDALALELAANNEQYADDIEKQWDAVLGELSAVHRVGGSGSGSESDGSGEGIESSEE